MMLYRRYLVGVSVFLLVMLIAGPLAAATVDPGAPDHFDVQVGPEARAGREFAVRLIIRDAEGNRVTGYNQLDRDIILKSSGDESLSRKEVSSKDFEDGELTVYLSYPGAEQIRVEAAETEHVARGRSQAVKVKAGEPENFEVKVPSVVQAGRKFTLELRAVDGYGNTVKNYNEKTSGIVLESTGEGEPRPAFVEADRFEGGKLQAQVKYEKAETVRFNLIDRSNEIEQTTSEVEISPASLAEFTLSNPERVRAGESFRSVIEARDKFGNIINDYNEAGEGVRLEFSGAGEIKPEKIAPEEFEEGVAFTKLTLHRAENGRIIAEDIKSGIRSEGERLRVVAGQPANFELQVPDKAVAGEDFEVKIAALDEYDNRVNNYDEVGEPVELKISRQGEDTLIQADDFENGRAVARLQHEDAEQIRVNAASDTLDINARSTTVQIRPAEPGDIVIKNPDEVRAGRGFQVDLKLVDSYGNTINQPTKYDGEVRVALINGKAGTEETISLADFSRGRAETEFKYEKAEKINVFAEYDQFDLRRRGDSIQVVPADFENIALTTPGEVRAGEEFDVSLLFEDKFGNPLQELPEDLKQIELNSSGGDQFEPRMINRSQMSVPSFSVRTSYFEAETIRVQALDGKGIKRGESALIRVRPGDLADFELQVPARVQADQEFPLRIKAVDDHQNIVKNLNDREGEIAFATSGEAELSPQTLNFKRFVDGVAEIEATYRQAEELVIFATSGQIRVRSDSFTVLPGKAAEYEVKIDSKIRAGKPFAAEIIAYDDFGNPVKKLPSDFPGVQLSSDGDHRLSPPRAESSLFENGRATVKLIYPRTGELQVQAAELEESPDNSLLDRVYFSRNLNQARVYLVGSAKIPFNVKERSSREDRVSVSFQPSVLATDGVSYSYNDWFLKQIKQYAGGSDNFPAVEVEIQPAGPVDYEIKRRENLVEIITVPEEVEEPPSIEEFDQTTMDTPADEEIETEEADTEAETAEEKSIETEEPEEEAAESTEDQQPPEEKPEEEEELELSEVQQLIEEEQYDEAAKNLDLYLEENPDDPEGNRLRHRLERIREVLD
ncbi:MAG: hypothetical protein ACQEP7_02430 [bacterium]